jgi:formate dehydrogenase major subunit/formate dehydrogenase alpha subunit
LNGLARSIIDRGIATGTETSAAFGEWVKTLESVSLESVSRETGVPVADIEGAAALWASGGGATATPGDPFPPALIYQTVAHQSATNGDNWYGDPGQIAAACNNLAVLTGNFGRAGGGVAALRGPANYQGATQMGAHPSFLPGGGDVESEDARQIFAGAWLARWGERARTSNGFVPVRTLPVKRGVSGAALAQAIERGQIKAMIIDGSLDGRDRELDPALVATLDKLEFLIVIDSFNSPIALKADIVLPKAVYLEKDGTFTNFDRTVQRVRAAVPPLGEARPVHDAVSMLSERMGYGLAVQPASQLMAEIGGLVTSYGGITYARLERNGTVTPVTSMMDPGMPILVNGADGRATFSPQFVATAL